MQIQRVLFTLVLGFLVSASCFAQDATKAEKRKAKAVKNTTKQMMKQFSAAELTDEQKEKATALVEKHIVAMMEARKAQEDLLSDEQKEKRKAGIAKAKEDGVKGNKVFAAGIEAMELGEDKLKEFNACRKKQAEITDKVKSGIKELLTEEQLAALPKKGNRKGKGKNKKDATTEGETQTVSLKLPGMT